ncbi:MAG: hypothetical protein FD153_1299 [Rhodospirillaceae bacterium]|nr:MAG: hypothetical protein FD153_1299 [Rhodospirillaceae bacterium]
MAPRASDPAQGDAFIREVDGDLREERLRQIWKRHGGLIVAMVVVIVVLVGGYEAWKQWQGKQAVAHALRYDAAVVLIESGRTSEGDAALAALAAEANGGYRVVATLRRAAALVTQGKSALALWEQVANDSAAPQPYREAAAFLAVLSSVDAPDTPERAALLESLTADTNPWRFSALEVSAVRALQRNDTIAARAFLHRLTDGPETPAGVRSRANALLQGLSPAG